MHENGLLRSHPVNMCCLHADGRPGPGQHGPPHHRCAGHLPEPGEASWSIMRMVSFLLLAACDVLLLPSGGMPVLTLHVLYKQIPTDVRGLTFSRTPQMLLNILFLGEAMSSLSASQAQWLASNVGCPLCHHLAIPCAIIWLMEVSQQHRYLHLLLQATPRRRACSSPTACWVQSTARWATTCHPMALSPSLPPAPRLAPRCAATSSRCDSLASRFRTHELLCSAFMVGRTTMW